MMRYRTTPLFRVLLVTLALISSTSEGFAGSLFSAGGWGTPGAQPAAPLQSLPSQNQASQNQAGQNQPVSVPKSAKRVWQAPPSAGAAAGTPVNSGICEREIRGAASKYGIPEGILYSVGLTETGRKGTLSPYAMNIEGKAYFPPSEAAAMMAFHDAKRQGAKLIDIGCMQINHYFHGEHFASPQQMFDPRSNVEYAAKFLRDLHDRHETWTMAVARYHAGPNNNPAQRQYVCRVISNLVATGYGSWTANSSSFCAG